MSTRNALASITGNLDDSMGVRAENAEVELAPLANIKDVGRRPLRNFGKLTLSQVTPDPEQPRAEFAQEDLEQLAESIRDKGQLHPIRVRWSDAHNSWLIISGERRYRAIKHAGLPTIDCCFQEGELSKTEILEEQLIENLLRCDLRPLEEAKAFELLLRLNGWTGKQSASALRITPSKVTRSLALLKLPKDIQHLVETTEITPTVAYELSKLPSPKQQRAALRKHHDSPLTVKTAGGQVRQQRGVSSSRRRGVQQTFLTEEGWKVTVTFARKASYHEMEKALQEALEEVRLRIDNNVALSYA